MSPPLRKYYGFYKEDRVNLALFGKDGKGKEKIIDLSSLGEILSLIEHFNELDNFVGYIRSKDE